MKSTVNWVSETFSFIFKIASVIGKTIGAPEATTCVVLDKKLPNTFVGRLPAGPVAPVAPVGPTGPIGPIGPCGPIEPVAPVGPVGPVGPGKP